MIDITTLRAMAAAGASVDVILAAVEAALLAEGARVEASKRQNADRQQRWRDRHNVTSRPVTLHNVTSQMALTSLLSSSESITKKVESKKERARKCQLPADWKPKPSHYDLAEKYKQPDSFVDRKADDLRDWALGKGIMRSDWDRTFNGFLKPKEGAFNGHGGPRPLQDDSKSISRAAGRLAEAARRGEFGFGPIPSLLPRKDDDPVLLLPKGRGT
jgi:hypothetical protein